MIKIQENIDLKPYTTLRVGGIARFFCQAQNRTELIEALDYAREKNLPFFVLGGGSNVLISEGIYDGLLILVRGEGQTGFAGESLPLWVNATASAQLSGLEGLAGIPGTIGGAVRGNAGAGESSISQVIDSVEIWEDGQIKTYSQSECEFAYRTSRFKTTGGVILGVKFNLTPTSADLTAQIKEKLLARSSKQPQGFSAGSIFKNPIDSKTAGELIDACGLKGLVHGGAKISEKHGNWIINSGNATTEDIIFLLRKAQADVLAKFGIKLEPEVQILNLNL